MEETLNSMFSELQLLNKNQQELMVIQKELIDRIENLEKVQKKLITSSKNINKVLEELIMGQHQLKIRIDNLEIAKDLFSLGQNEIKVLIKQTAIYSSGKLSFSEKIIMEIDFFNERERQDVLNRINAKTVLRKNNTWAENWDDDQYNDY